ncbi:hypothetical protein GCM10027341_09570 [Spirosoma knui]
MENTNQDAMLNEQSQTFTPETGGPAQVPDQALIMNQAYNPTDLSGDANGMPMTPTDEQEAATGSDGTGALSGSPNMEPDLDPRNYGNGDTLGNNDGTETSPEADDYTVQS